MSAVDRLSYAPPRPDDIPALDTLLEQALSFPVGGMAPWTAVIGHEHMRVVRQGERVVAGLGVIPFGHWFGGRVVPTGGVTAVGVAPDRRGSGVGRWMLRQLLEEQHARGVPLLSLYPATTAFYRRVGFERAAQRLIYELPLAAIDLRDYTLDAEPVAAAQLELLKGVYALRAARGSSFIARPDFYWQRMLASSDKPSYAFAALRDGIAEGYVIFQHAVWGEPLQVRDLLALTPAAGRRLLTVLADHRSILETVRLPAGPQDPLLFLLPEQKQRVFRSLNLMLRILDLAAALAARGYPPGVAAELHLEVVDDLRPWNQGRFVLRVADGVGGPEQMTGSREGSGTEPVQRQRRRMDERSAGVTRRASDSEQPGVPPPPQPRGGPASDANSSVEPAEGQAAQRQHRIDAHRPGQSGATHGGSYPHGTRSRSRSRSHRAAG